MRKTPTALPVCFAFLLAGCAQAPTPTAGVAAPGGNTCALADTAGNTCVDRVRPNGEVRRICHLYAGRMGDKLFVFPYRLSTPGPSATRTIIVWHLLDPGIVFRDADGPLELKNHNEFRGARPTDDIDGDPDANESAAPPAQGRRYRIRFLNTRQGTYDYNIQATINGQPKKCDPRIVNDGN
jgi:hypothetical protein